MRGGSRFSIFLGEDTGGGLVAEPARSLPSARIAWHICYNAHGMGCCVMPMLSATATDSAHTPNILLSSLYGISYLSLTKGISPIYSVYLSLNLSFVLLYCCFFDTMEDCGVPSSNIKTCKDGIKIDARGARLARYLLARTYLPLLWAV